MIVLKVAAMIVVASCGATALLVLWDWLCWHFASDHSDRSTGGTDE